MILSLLREAIDAKKFLLVPEGGGNAALSFVRMMRELFDDLKIVGVDCDQRVEALYAAMGYRFVLESEVRRELMGSSFLLPTDELFGNRMGMESPLARSSMRKVMYNKFRCHQFLAGEIRQYVELPPWFRKVVVRGNSQSGGKGMLVHTSGPEAEGVLVTQYYENALEVQVDLIRYDDEHLVFYPRITTRLHKGADTHVTLMGQKHSLYTHAFHATREIASLLGIVGIANIQFLVTPTGQFTFLEAALRFSGSSWTNLFAGPDANPLLEKGFGDFISIHASTQAGLGKL